MSDVRLGAITPQTRRRWAVKAAVGALVVLVLTPVVAVAADTVMGVPRGGFTTSGVLATFLVLGLLVLVVVDLAWAAGGERPPRARWLPLVAGAFALVGVVLAALRYDPTVDRIAPLMVVLLSGTGFAAFLAQSIRISR